MASSFKTMNRMNLPSLLFTSQKEFFRVAVNFVISISPFHNEYLQSNDKIR